MVKPTRLAFTPEPTPTPINPPFPPGEPTTKSNKTIPLPPAARANVYPRPHPHPPNPRPFIRRRTEATATNRVRPAPQPTPELLLRKPANEPDTAVQLSSSTSQPVNRSANHQSKRLVLSKKATKQSKHANKPPPARGKAPRPVSRYLQPQSRGGTYIHPW
jgi:hypothetical protein